MGRPRRKLSELLGHGCVWRPCRSLGLVHMCNMLFSEKQRKQMEETQRAGQQALRQEEPCAQGV